MTYTFAAKNSTAVISVTAKNQSDAWDALAAEVKNDSGWRLETDDEDDQEDIDGDADY